MFPINSRCKVWEILPFHKFCSNSLPFSSLDNTYNAFLGNAIFVTKYGCKCLHTKWKVIKWWIRRQQCTFLLSDQLKDWESKEKQKNKVSPQEKQNNYELTKSLTSYMKKKKKQKQNKRCRRHIWENNSKWIATNKKINVIMNLLNWK